jgi:hypothetical protein
MIFHTLELKRKKITQKKTFSSSRVGGRNFTFSMLLQWNNIYKYKKKKCCKYKVSERKLAHCSAQKCKTTKKRMFKIMYINKRKRANVMWECYFFVLFLTICVCMQLFHLLFNSFLFSVEINNSQSGNSSRFSRRVHRSERIFVPIKCAELTTIILQFFKCHTNVGVWASVCVLYVCYDSYLVKWKIVNVAVCINFCIILSSTVRLQCVCLQRG